MTANIMTVTQCADSHVDTLSDADYREIFCELRGQGDDGKFAVSLDKLVELLGSQYSKALWSQFGAGGKANRTMRSELRRAACLPPLPPTLAEASALADPDALVLRAGAAVPTFVVMLSPDAGKLLLDAASLSCTPFDDVELDEVLPPAKRRARRPFARPMADAAQLERRAALGATWRAVIDAGLESLERDKFEQLLADFAQTLDAQVSK